LAVATVGPASVRPLRMSVQAAADCDVSARASTAASIFGFFIFESPSPQKFRAHFRRPHAPAGARSGDTFDCREKC
jgi:hypothetical protein